MNLVHELVYVLYLPVAMSRSQLAQLNGCNVIFGSAGRKMRFQMRNIKLVRYGRSPHITTRRQK
jgi:hypothetical protein